MIATPYSLFRAVLRPAMTPCLIGLGALLACSLQPVHAQYADWNANPPKILPNERVAMGPAWATGSGRQCANENSFAALKSDGSVVTWGDPSTGGDSTSVTASLSSDVIALYSNPYAYAALKNNGSVVTWGYANAGGNSTSVAASLSSDVIAVHSTRYAFAALKGNGSVVTWGGTDWGGNSTIASRSGYASVAGSLSSDVEAIYSNHYAFVALKKNGSVVAWGSADGGGNATSMSASLSSGVKTVFSTALAFAALKDDGSVVTWGDATNGGNSGSVAASLTSDVTTIYSNAFAFAALKKDGSLVTWGNSTGGGNSSAVATSLSSDVINVYSTYSGFAALKRNGSVVTWGNPEQGGNSSIANFGVYTSVAESLTQDVIAVYSSAGAFAALKSDGSVVTWGDKYRGGDSSSVAASLSSGVTNVYSSAGAFAAVKADGSVVTWGDSSYGGNSNPVAARLSSGVITVYSNIYAFAALKRDGSVVVWGSPTRGGGSGPEGTDIASVQSVSYYDLGVAVSVSSETLTSSTASLFGEVTREGKTPVTARGFVYALATVADPKIGEPGVTQVTDSGSGLGSFSTALSGLSPNTAYVFKAYAIDEDGATYSPVAAFSTNLSPLISSNSGSSTASVSVAENSNSVTTVNATDADAGQTITYSITGGTDAARFVIGSSSGALTFVPVPDFEAPVDTNADNIYQVIVTATDNGNTPKSATQTLTVTVTNESDSGEIAVEQPEGTNLTKGGTVTFGSVTVGQPKEIVFTVRSSGEVPLLLNGATFPGSNAGEFALVGSLQSSLAVGSSTTFTVRFTPSGGGTRSAALSLPNNDQSGGESPFVINLSGTGVSSATVATYANAANQVRGGWINNGNFTIGAVGTTNPGNNWPSAEGPDKVVDSNTGSKFLIFRNSNAGLIFSPSNSNVVFNRLSLSTANDASERDPASYVIYGSSTALSGTAGTNISLAELTELASGTITLPDNRTTGPTVVQFANNTAYASYIVAFPTVRSTTSNNLTQISEVQLSQGINPPFAVAMAGVRGGQLSSGTFTFGSIGSSNPGTNWLANESPDQAIDGSTDTKYLIFRNAGAGLIASPQAGPSRVNRLSFWTANDFSERDPLTYQVYGFATAVTARSGTLNVATSGNLLGSGTVTLPATRNAGPTTVTFTNSTAYASYLVVFPTVKNSPATPMTQISELQFSYNGVPDFSLPQQVLSLNENSGPQTNSAYATDITAGLGDVGQTVSFSCTNDNNALFSGQPAIAPDGTLTFTTATDSYGSATVTVVATDNFGSTSAPKTFRVEVAIVPLISRSAASLGDFTALTGNASSSQSFSVNGRALTGPVVVTAPAGFEVSKDNSIFSSNLTLSTKTGVIENVYGGNFSIGSGKIWNSGNGQEYPNLHAFVAITSAGSVVAWGDSRYGGNSSAVADNLTSNVTAVYSNAYAFAALKTDGSVITWGSALQGGDSSAVASSLSSGVVAIYSTSEAFAALKTNGSVVTWGYSSSGGDSSSVANSLISDVVAVYSNAYAFAALKADGSVVTWGASESGGNSSSVANKLNSNIKNVYSTTNAFAALKVDGSIVTWGSSYHGGDSTSVASKLNSNFKEISSTSNAFAALKMDGSVVAWGDSLVGGDSSVIADKLTANVSAVYSTNGAFAALKTDGSVVTWGLTSMGGNSAAVANSLISDVVTVYSNSVAFAALKTNGSAVTWGNASAGGDSAMVASSLSSGIAAIYSNSQSFAALKTNGSVVTWGNSNLGGNSSSVAGSLTSNVAAVYPTLAAFAALKTDGSVVTWGGANYGGTGGPANIGVNEMPATLYVRLASTATVGSASGNITLTSSGAQTQTVAIAGTITSGPSYTHQELWRFANFGSYASENSGADSADPDGDGISNLLEYALGLDPAAPGVMPAVLALNGANVEYTYTRSTAAKDNGVTYQIEWSETLEAGSWSTETVSQQITSTQGALETVKASVPAGTGGKRFLRLRVGSAPLQTP